MTGIKYISNIDSKSLLEKIFNEPNKINCIINLAANVGGLFKNMNYKVDMLEINLLI